MQPNQQPNKPDQPAKPTMDFLLSAQSQNPDLSAANALLLRMLQNLRGAGPITININLPSSSISTPTTEAAGSTSDTSESRADSVAPTPVVSQLPQSAERNDEPMDTDQPEFSASLAPSIDARATVEPPSESAPEDPASTKSRNPLRRSKNQPLVRHELRPHRGKTRQQRRVEGVYHPCVEECGKTFLYADCLKRHMHGVFNKDLNKMTSTPCPRAAEYAQRLGISAEEIMRVRIREVYSGDDAKQIDFSTERPPWSFYDPSLPANMPRKLSLDPVYINVDRTGERRRRSIADYSHWNPSDPNTASAAASGSGTSFPTDKEIQEARSDSTASTMTTASTLTSSSDEPASPRIDPLALPDTLPAIHEENHSADSDPLHIRSSDADDVDSGMTVTYAALKEYRFPPPHPSDRATPESEDST